MSGCSFRDMESPGCKSTPFVSFPNTTSRTVVIDCKSVISQGASVNDSTDPNLCCISYVQIDEDARRVVQVGELLATLAFGSACQVVLVHLDDQPLLRILGR